MLPRPIAAFTWVLRWGSAICCLIVVASFAVFVVNQTSSASNHQQKELGGGSVVTTTTVNTGAHKSTARRILDEASKELTSPFDFITSSWHSQWAIRLVGTLLALLLYGLVVRYFVRVMRVRV